MTDSQQSRDTPPAIAILGAGPAGLMAAEILSAAGLGVTVYERMPTPGRKLLIAGRGGLNLTHSEPFDRLEFLPACRAWHHGYEGEIKKACKIRFADCGRARRRLYERHVASYLAVADAIEEQGSREAMFQAARWVCRFVLKIDRNVAEPAE